MQRRSRIGVAAITLVTMATVATACGPNANTSSAPPASSGPWEFTDDAGQTITADTMPTRIIAQEDAAAALWSFGIRPIATYGYQPLSENPQFEGVDVSGVDTVGEAFGEINIEKIAALDPDLIVTSLWPSEGPAGGGFKNENQKETIAGIAPIAELQANVPFSDLIGRYQDLAVALGADLGSEEVAASLERYEAASSAFGEVVAAHPDLRVLAVSPTTDQLYVGMPTCCSDLQDYAADGMEFVIPDPDLRGDWDTLSWEEVDRYGADVVLYDARAGVPTPEQLDQDVPTWGLIPAVEADQLAPWFVGTTYALDFYSDTLEQVTEVIDRSSTLS
jgi:iron complex transport system substrate-binding protein